jgi:hypothetical protein
VEIVNSTSNDSQVRTTPPPTTSTKRLPGSPFPAAAAVATEKADPAPGWCHLTKGASLQVQVPTTVASTVEFKLPNGRTLVQVVDARTQRVDLVEDKDGSYRTVLTPAPGQAAPPLPKAAAGGRR